MECFIFNSMCTDKLLLIRSWAHYLIWFLRVAIKCLLRERKNINNPSTWPYLQQFLLSYPNILWCCCCYCCCQVASVMSNSVRPHRRQPTGSPVPGILQARTLEWLAISFSKWKVKVKPLSRVQLLVTPWTAAYQAPPSTGFSRQEYWSWVPLPSP